MAPAAGIEVLPGLVVQPATEGPSGRHTGAVTSCPCAHRWTPEPSNRSVSKYTVPVASNRMVIVPGGIDMHGGSLPPPPPAGAGGSAIPAPKMFEVPGTSTVAKDPHGTIRPGTAVALVIGAFAVFGGSPPAAVQLVVSTHTIPRAVSGRGAFDQPIRPGRLISPKRTAVTPGGCKAGLLCRASRGWQVLPSVVRNELGRLGRYFAQGQTDQHLAEDKGPWRGVVSTDRHPLWETRPSSTRLNRRC